VWTLNHGFFAEEKKIRSKMKIVILCRPDLIYASGMHNAGIKISDNGICMNWVTNNAEARKSPLYAFTNHIFECQQPDEAGDWIQRYWPECDVDAMFREMLRLTWHRPRDFVMLLRTLRENRIQGITAGPVSEFTWGDMNNPALVRKFSDYMLGEVKDFALFYMTPCEFDVFLRFFQFLNGKSEFDYAFSSSAIKSLLDR
jgi:hypothetical protein